MSPKTPALPPIPSLPPIPAPSVAAVEAPADVPTPSPAPPDPPPAPSVDPAPVVAPAPAVDESKQVTDLKNKLWTAERDIKAAKDEAASAKVRLDTISADLKARNETLVSDLASTKKALDEANANLKNTAAKLAALEAKERPTSVGAIKQLVGMGSGELVVLCESGTMFKIPPGSNQALPFTPTYKTQG